MDKTAKHIKSRLDRSSSADQIRAFTLIEVLVVIAIIGLLISIILPSLAKARDQARAAVCLTRLQQAGRAQALYTTTNNGWIAGSPLTTGYSIAKSGAWEPETPGFNRFVINWLDWATPLRVQMTGPSSIPDPRGHAEPLRPKAKIYELLTAEPFDCPSNNAPMSSPWPLEPDEDKRLPIIKPVSYLSMWTIMRGGPDLYEQLVADPSLFPGAMPPHSSPDRIAQRDTWELVVPDQYMPRLRQVGPESMKVFLADGLRFFEPGGQTSYSTDPNDAKGPASGEPPSSYTPGNPTHSREYLMAKDYSYRHGDRDRIQAVFFDGHCEAMLATTKSKGPFRGPAVHPKHYYPSGTIVKDPSRIHLDIPAGTVLP